MQWMKLPVGSLQANAYILYDEARDDALVIDPGAEPERVQAALDGRRLSGILLTHGHGDHIGAVASLRGPDVPVYIHRLDARALVDPAISLAGMMSDRAEQGPADVLLDEGEVTIAGIELTILHTPGHTPGGICVRVGDDLFTGDTLFKQGYGRTDFPGGDLRLLSASLKRLFGLGDALRVHPGHGEDSTIGAERRHYSL